eukprot:3310012-Rhodomonas_salina.1
MFWSAFCDARPSANVHDVSTAVREVVCTPTEFKIGIAATACSTHLKSPRRRDNAKLSTQRNARGHDGEDTEEKNTRGRNQEGHLADAAEEDSRADLHV